MANVQRTYDIEEYQQKALAALNKLEQTQKPGQSQKGSKSDVIQAIKGEIKALMDKGYTSEQIAEALKNDVFGVLPKTITELVKGKKPAVKRTKESRTTAATNQTTKQTTDKATKQATESKASFAVKPDSEDI